MLIKLTNAADNEEMHYATAKEREVYVNPMYLAHTRPYKVNEKEAGTRLFFVSGTGISGELVVKEPQQVCIDMFERFYKEQGK